MTFPLDRIQLGPHAYGKRPGTFGVTLHTDEGRDNTLQSALDTIRMQSPGGSLYKGGGSYHWLLTDQGPVLAVPYLEAAGGILGDHTPPSQISPITGLRGVWQPQPFLKTGLPPAAYSDPNAYMLQIAVAGKTALLQTYPAIQRVIDDAAAIIQWAQALPEIADSLLVHGHSSWQTNRSDPGQWFLDQVKARMEGDMPVILRPVREKWVSKFSPDGKAGYFTTDGPGLGERKWFTAAETVESYAETTDGRYRAIAYSSGAETLWMERGQLNPIGGTRVPATGYGLAVPDCSVQDAKLAKVRTALPALGQSNTAEALAIEALTKVVA